MAQWHNGQSKSEYLPYGENLVKISQVDPEIALLKGLFLKINASRTYSPRVMHAARAKQLK